MGLIGVGKEPTGSVPIGSGPWSRRPGRCETWIGVGRRRPGSRREVDRGREAATRAEGGAAGSGRGGDEVRDGFVRRPGAADRRWMEDVEGAGGTDALGDGDDRASGRGASRWEGLFRGADVAARRRSRPENRREAVSKAGHAFGGVALSYAEGCELSRALAVSHPPAWLSRR